ncbi:hypothetical protein [Agromyces bauzanensis]
MASDLLSSATANSTLDHRAADECDSTLSGHPLVAAVDSSVSEVRRVGDQVETVAGWADALPARAEHYAAICIFDAEGVQGIRGNPDFVAFWVSHDSSSGGSGVITAGSRGSEANSH